ncbi:MAG: hypothetical protein NT062_27045 [Proteobacteria bacterium]|nr:hypothetical protein [Pseudomonadota bacterium]
MQLRPGAAAAIGMILGAAVALDVLVLLVFGDNLNTSAFLTSTSVIALAIAAAAALPKLVGHGLAALLGITSVVAGFNAVTANMTPTLPVTLLIVGLLLGWLAYLSVRGSRVAWSFLVAITGVMFVCMFFGAPKVRSILGLNIWFALIPPGMFGASTIALALLSKDYATESST